MNEENVRKSYLKLETATYLADAQVLWFPLRSRLLLQGEGTYLKKLDVKTCALIVVIEGVKVAW